MLQQHTWYQGDAGDATTACRDQKDYANHKNVDEGISDGVRDTPPQLPLEFGNSTTNAKPIFFNCKADGSFNPQGEGMQAVTMSTCAANGQLYFNNIENMMSYHNTDCDKGSRKKTFTPGQIARARCIWRCYRARECFVGGVNGAGTFPF
jgi:hypothetical protein